MNQPIETITQVLSQNQGIRADLITPTASLLGDLNLSNLEIADTVSLLSQICKFNLPQDLDLEKIQTVQDLVEFVEQNCEDIV